MALNRAPVLECSFYTVNHCASVFPLESLVDKNLIRPVRDQSDSSVRPRLASMDWQLWLSMVVFHSRTITAGEVRELSVGHLMKWI